MWVDATDPRKWNFSKIEFRVFSYREFYADSKYVIISMCQILKFWDMGLWSWVGGLNKGFLSWVCLVIVSRDIDGLYMCR